MATLLNLTVDLIFIDATNTYFGADDPGGSQLKAYGESKDKWDDLPLITIRLAVTREGIPVKCWELAGNQHDAKRVDQVQRDLNSSKLGRIVWVMDRGMSSEEIAGYYNVPEGSIFLVKNSGAIVSAKQL